LAPAHQRATNALARKERPRTVSIVGTSIFLFVAAAFLALAASQRIAHLVPPLIGALVVGVEDDGVGVESEHAVWRMLVAEDEQGDIPPSGELAQR